VAPAMPAPMTMQSVVCVSMPPAYAAPGAVQAAPLG
jgi:hypothetical protein